MSSRNDSSSRSRSRDARGALSAFGAKLNRALSKDGSVKDEPPSAVSTVVGEEKPRSVSRGRESLGSYSTGRGGAGNMIRSPSRGVGPIDTPTPYEQEVLKNHAEAEKLSSRARSSGRGGLGNVRSPSVDGSRPKGDVSDIDPAFPARGRIDKLPPSSPSGMFSTGRGGAGNMRSRSRDPKDVLQTIEEPSFERQNRHERG